MQHTRLALLFAASVAAGFISLVACDTDNGTVPIPGGGSSGASSSGKSSSGKPGDDDTGDDDTGDDDTQGDDDDDDNKGDADCSKAPRLRKTDAGFYCSFLEAGTFAGTGGSQNCPSETICCNTNKKKDDGKFYPTFCAPNDNPGQGAATCADKDEEFNSDFAPGTAWECAAANNCPGDQKCCAMSFDGADAGNYVNVGFIPQSEENAPPKACNAKKFFKIAGTKCATSCADKKEIEICSSNESCSGGKKCYPAAAGNSRELGACL